MGRLSETEKLEWSSVGILFYEIESSIVEFKKDRVSNRDISYFNGGIDFLKSVLEAKEEDRKGFAKRENLTNSTMFLEGWMKSNLTFPKNDEEYLEEVKNFIACFKTMSQRKKPDMVILNKIERLFSFLGELALLKIHRSPLTSHYDEH